MGDGSRLQPEHVVCRRKLLENVMSGFVVGNTNARGIDPAYLDLSQERGQMNILYLGVGDMRNPLTTIHSVDAKVKECKDSPKCRPLPLCLHLNDMNTIVLARNAIFLLLAAHATCIGTVEQATAAAIAMWSDAYFLTKSIPTQLAEALNKLIDESDSQSLMLGGVSWLRAGSHQSFVGMRSHWMVWRALLQRQVQEAACGEALGGKTTQMLRSARDAAIKFALGSTDIAVAGHARTGASGAWLRHGIASVSLPSAMPLCTANPTLYQHIDEEWKFLDIQVITYRQ